MAASVAPSQWQPIGWSMGLHGLLLAVVLLVASYRPTTDPLPRMLAIEATLVQQAPVRARAEPPASKPTPTPAPTPAPAAKPAAKPVSTPTPVAVVAAAAKPPAVKPLAAKPAPARPAVAVVPDTDQPRREAELRAQLAAEERADALRTSGAVAQWTQAIRGKVERAWLRPPSVTAALDCVVRVTQVPGGEVVRVDIQACNGDSSARESITAAVYRASPLPQPPDPSLFERVIEFRFRPND